MESQVARFLDLSHAAGSVSLRLTRVAENRMWEQDAYALGEIVDALKKMIDERITLVSSSEGASKSALATPQSLDLMSTRFSDLGGLAALVSELRAVADAAGEHRLDSEICGKARTLAIQFDELDSLAEEKAAISGRGGNVLMSERRLGRAT